MKQLAKFSCCSSSNPLIHSLDHDHETLNEAALYNEKQAPDFRNHRSKSFFNYSSNENFLGKNFHLYP